MAITHIVQLGTANIAAANKLNLLNYRGVHRKSTLNTNTEGNLTYSEGFANTSALASNNKTFENLNTAVLTLNDVHMNIQGVAGCKFGNVVTKGLLVEKIKSLNVLLS